MKLVLSLLPSTFTPCIGETSTERAEFTANLFNDISCIIDQNRNIISFISSESIQSLIENNHYPFNDVVYSLMKPLFDRGIYDVNDYVSLLNSILDKSSNTLDVFGVSSILFDNLDVQEADFSWLAESEKPAELETISASAIHVLDFLTPEVESITASPFLSSNPVLCGDFILSEPNNTQSAGLVTPKFFECTLKNWNESSHLFDFLDGEEIWRSAFCSSDVLFAIRVKAYHLIKAESPDFCSPMNIDFQVGEGFFSSLERNQSVREQKFGLATFVVASHVVAKSGRVEATPFRTSRSPNSSQKIRPSDGAKAWRCHVTSRNEGMRLMYWEYEDGKIELSAVGPKSELKID